MPGLIWTRQAVRDMQRLFDFLKTKNPEAARKAAMQIQQAATSLQLHPRMGKPMPDDSGRRELAASFSKKGYILRYKFDDDNRVVIIRVWHYLEQRSR